MTKLPDYLLPSNRKNAIHFMSSKTIDTPLYGPTEVTGAACGVAIKDWTNRLATEPHRVTCRQCYMICHPRPSMFQERK